MAASPGTVGLLSTEAIYRGHAFPKGPNWRPRSKAQQNEDMISLVCYMRFFVIKKKKAILKSTSRENLSPLAEWHFMSVHIAMSVFEEEG